MRSLASLSTIGTAVGLFACAALCGCTDGELTEGGSEVSDAGSGTVSDAEAGRPPVPPGSTPGAADSCEKMDILFVIDDSGSMREEQTNLAANFPQFIEVLDAFTSDGGLPLDYRVAVTTTSKPFSTTFVTPLPLPTLPLGEDRDGPRGELLMGDGCGMTRRWLERDDPNVVDQFSCVANVGTGGSSTEMPLLMWELALTERVADGTNAGFLREDALLAVVILTDEDDCSRDADSLEINLDPTMIADAARLLDRCNETDLTPIDRVLSSIDAVKGDRGRWAAAVIAGPGPDTCSSEFGQAIEAARLQEFLGRAGDNTVFSSICEGDLAAPLQRALETFDTACRNFPPLI